LKTRADAGRRDCLRLLVLAPHRDCRRIIRLLSPELFRRGFYGAWSFPQVVPLAVLSAPLTEGELKTCARSLRALNLGEKGRIGTGDMAAAVLRGGAANGAEAGPGELRLAGPSLDLAVPEPFPAGENKVLRRISPVLLGAALIREDDSVPDIRIPPLSFRAAALANMIYRPLDGSGCSFRWRLGKPAWLPRIKKAARGGTEDR
jgi:hypothetical protein